MSLVSRLTKEFDLKIRNRGGEYYRSRVVEIVNHSKSQVDAIVRGTKDYLVRLRLSRVSLNVACTCPYFDEAEACKHIWATMLECDRLLYLAEATSRPQLDLYFDYQALEELKGAGEDDLLDEDDDDLEDEQFSPAVPHNLAPAPPAGGFALQPPPGPAPVWKKQLTALTSLITSDQSNAREAWPAGREIFYLVDGPASSHSGKLSVDVSFRERTMKGEWGKIKTQRVPLKQIPTIKDETDRQILTLLSGAKDPYVGTYSYGNESLPQRCQLSAGLQELIVPLMCATGRCRLRRFDRDKDLPVLSWDANGSWELWLTAELTESGDEYALRGVLRRGAEQVEISTPLVFVEGLLIDQEFRIARIETLGVSTWAAVLKATGGLRVPAANSEELIEHLLALPIIPRLDLPAELEFARVQFPPAMHLIMRRPKFSYSTQLEADLFFEYENAKVHFGDAREGIYDPPTRRLILRDREGEARALERLKPLGFRLVQDYAERRRRLDLAPGNLPRAVKALLGEGWKVEAEGKLYRKPGSMSMSVSSGIDWFELHGEVEFGEGLHAKLPALLTALKRGETMVQLGDGSFGLLPDDWLKKYGLLASLGETEADHLRFKQTQTGVLDALLAAQPEITCDEVFTRVREEWRNFKGIAALDPPPSFIGTLREYQREGLGWFEFLQRFGFGGCLADDMGLGKTVQVLALLDSRRVARANGGQPEGKSGKQKILTPAAVNANGSQPWPRPSLVVVPRSLIFNWEQEAARFAPQLRVLTHTGGERTRGSAHFEEYDLVLTTYGTLRRDAIHFKDAEFDFVILDESQAIKNSKTESAKAARLLRGKHRLALSGTPIENHLGELWSLFEFLNPGMLGAASVFQLSGTAARQPSDDTKTMLARALRPFILRRTKQEVAKDLPEKLEQTIYCEMEPAQRKMYDELRDYYRASLLDHVERVGINRSKIQILEALLRLRQAACHPGLVNKEGVNEPSAKLDLLVPRLGEVTAEGHKALVFSQFTSFLSILRRRLDEEGITYEYLDGKTRDRAAKVERFQNDPDCKLFLISLKAGGLGLNLTAAEYVFLLDPWWNPAVEAQAIDRAHRIGQSQRVFAYRLITRETVEEKVLALQATKRELADAIISADNSLIKNITGEDLLLLLS